MEESDHKNVEELIMRQSPKDLEGSARIGAAKIRKALDDLMEWKKAHHGKMSADETLIHLFNTLVTNLFELKDAKSSDEDRFAYGSFRSGKTPSSTAWTSTSKKSFHCKIRFCFLL